MTEEKLAQEFLDDIKKKMDFSLAFKKLNEAWTKQNYRIPPAHWAAFHGKINFLHALALSGANMNEVDPLFHSTPLTMAIRAAGDDGETYCAELLIKNHKIYKIDLNLQSPLLIACRENPDIAEMLIKAGANIDANDHDNIALGLPKGYCPLMAAASHNYPQVVSALLKAGAEINQSTSQKFKEIPRHSTALMRAAVHGQVAVINILAKNSADLNAVNNEGQTALELALENKKYFAAATLIACGATISKNAQELINKNLKWDKEQIEKIKTAKTSKNERLIHSFVLSINALKKEKNKKTMLELLDLAWGNVEENNPPNASRITPLMYCIQNNDNEGIQALVRAGLDLNEVKILGLSPVMWAIHKNYDYAIESLIYAGAEPNVKDKNDIVKLLQSQKLEIEGSKFDSSKLENSKMFNTLSYLALLPRDFENKKEKEKEKNPVEKRLSEIIQLSLPLLTCKSEKIRKETLSSVMNAFKSQKENNLSPLTWAIKNGNIKIVKALLEAGADVNEMDANGDLPLCLAAGLRGTYTLQLLLEKPNADIDKRNKIDNSPLLEAVIHNPFNVQFLVNQGANIFHINEYQMLPIKEAITRASPIRKQLIKCFIDNGNDISVSNFHNGKSVLHYAVTNSEYPEDCLETLISLAANMNQIDSDGTTFYHFIEQRKIQDAYKEEIRKMITDEKTNKIKNDIKEVGHILGLSSNIPVPITNVFKMNTVLIKEPSTLLIKTESESPSFGVGLLQKRLEGFLGNESKKLLDTPWKKVQEAFNCLKPQIQEHWPYFKETLPKILNENYLSNKLTIIPSGWIKHGISVALYKDKIIITNRGDEGDPKFGSKIYTLSPEKQALINEEFFKKLLDCQSESLPNFFDFLAKDGFLDLKKIKEGPYAKFPSKEQKHGTCGFVNHKSSIESFLFLFKSEEAQVSQKEAMEYARKEYKGFTTQIREKEIERLIQKINNPKNDKEVESVLLNLVVAILKEHHDLPDETSLTPEKAYSPRIKDTEIMRAIRLKQALPKHYNGEIQRIIKEENDTELRQAWNVCEGYEAKLKKDSEMKLKEKQQKKSSDPYLPPSSSSSSSVSGPSAKK